MWVEWRERLEYKLLQVEKEKVLMLWESLINPSIYLLFSFSVFFPLEFRRNIYCLDYVLKYWVKSKHTKHNIWEM